MSFLFGTHEESCIRNLIPEVKMVSHLATINCYDCRRSIQTSKKVNNRCCSLSCMYCTKACGPVAAWFLTWGHKHMKISSKCLYCYLAFTKTWLRTCSLFEVASRFIVFHDMYVLVNEWYQYKLCLSRHGVGAGYFYM